VAGCLRVSDALTAAGWWRPRKDTLREHVRLGAANGPSALAQNRCLLHSTAPSTRCTVPHGLNCHLQPPPAAGSLVLYYSQHQRLAEASGERCLWSSSTSTHMSLSLVPLRNPSRVLVTPHALEHWRNDGQALGVSTCITKASAIAPSSASLTYHR
jgi:hypothetical protein